MKIKSHIMRACGTGVAKIFKLFLSKGKETDDKENESRWYIAVGEIERERKYVINRNRK